MYKKTFTCEDFDGNQVTDTYYFNFTKVELMDLASSKEGGLDKYVEKIQASNDIQKMISLFRELMDKSYGRKSDDGKRFIKNADMLEEFQQTNAYSELFMLFATNDAEAASFINGIMPKDLVTEAEKQKALSANTTPIQ